jgi:PKHD-type hydroxylase
MPLGQLRKRGTVIIFPSFLQHRVTEVKRGTRYSLVQWYNGPEFK